jgi:hypothetical protein
MGALLDAALGYAARGIPVYPSTGPARDAAGRAWPARVPAGWPVTGRPSIPSSATA